MEKERFFYLKRRHFATDKSYYVIDVLDLVDALTVSIFTTKENYDYFSDTETMEDISHFIKFHCNNNSGIYRPSIDRKE